jgi:hypothetical protein
LASRGKEWLKAKMARNRDSVVKSKIGPDSETGSSHFPRISKEERGKENIREGSNL